MSTLPVGFKPIPGFDLPDSEKTVTLIDAKGRTFSGCLVTDGDKNEEQYWCEWMYPQTLELREGKEMPVGWAEIDSSTSIEPFQIEQYHSNASMNAQIRL